MNRAVILTLVLGCALVSACVDGPRWERTMASAKSEFSEGKYDLAEHSLLDALNQAERLHPLHPYQLETNTELARLYLKTGAYDRGKLALARVISKLEVLQNDQSPALAKLHSELGRVCDLLGQFDEARDHYARALPVTMKAPVQNDLDYLLLDMAVNAGHRKQYAEAEDYFGKAQLAAEVLHPRGSILEEIRAKRAEIRR